MNFGTNNHAVSFLVCILSSSHALTLVVQSGMNLNQRQMAVFMEVGPLADKARMGQGM